MQLCKFPMEYLRVTQGENGSHSHEGSLAMDFGGKDTGSDKLYAPFDFKVVRARTQANGELYIESVEPVKFADGTEDYCHLLFIHDGLFNVKEDVVYPQGHYFYDEGGMGSNNPNKFGIHVHIEGGKGKWDGKTYQSKNQNGVYVSPNQDHLYDLFILGNDVIELPNEEVPSYNYDWVRVRDLETEPSIPAGTIEEMQSVILNLEREIEETRRENDVLKASMNDKESYILELEKSIVTKDKIIVDTSNTVRKVTQVLIDDGYLKID